MARPSMVRSGQKARPKRRTRRWSSGSTMPRVVPTLTVLRRITSGSRPKAGPRRSTAARIRSRFGRSEPGSSGVPTVMM
jgi:hypothetical protein